MKARRIDIKLSDYEFKQIEAEAIRRGMNKSELIRSLIAQFPAPPKAAIFPAKPFHPRTKVTWFSATHLITRDGGMWGWGISFEWVTVMVMGQQAF